MKKISFLIVSFIFVLFVSSVKADTTKTDDEVTGDIFEKRKHFFHPSLAIGGEWSDNVFNENEDQIEDFFWVISPEIWISLPGTRSKKMDLAVSPKTPAGFTLSLENPEVFRRYSAYLLYGADILRYTEITEEDTESHKFEGQLQFNFRNGLTIELMDQYVDTFDPVGVAPFTRHDEFEENLFNTLIYYDFSDKFKLRFDFTHIDLNYEDRPFDEIPLIGRDRQDMAYGGYLFFKVRPKTSIFAQYRFIDIDYELNFISNDSDEHHYWGGVEWKMSPKSKGRLKLGYGYKDFDEGSNKEDDGTLILEGQFSHQLTPKTSIHFNGFRRTEETTIRETDYVLTHGASAQYNQRFTEKLTGHLFLSYAWDHYQGELALEGETKERKEDLIRLRPSLRYELTRWLMADAAYSYTKRDSNFSIFDFDENRFSIRILISLNNRSAGLSDKNQ